MESLLSCHARYRLFTEMGDSISFILSRGLFLLSFFVFLTSCQDEDEWVPDVDYSAYNTDDPAYHVASLVIDTENAQPVDSKKNKDYRNCRVQIVSDEGEWNTSCTGKIRGRGNSTWEWYDKKPYRLKLDEVHSLLGLPEGRDWVLLANYRDPTDMLNTFAFLMGNSVGMPFTNHTRYVELTLNGTYLGLYQLTEQVMVGHNRVDISEETGILLALDRNDGPKMSPKAEDNFWSAVYELPVCVKYPDVSSDQQLEDIRQEFAKLEQAIQSKDYDLISKMMNMEAFADFMLIQEFVCNTELTGPRSLYIHRSNDGRWTMGPLWDFDAAYSFSWFKMKLSHRFFEKAELLIMGSDPYSQKEAWKPINRFFTDMWSNARFVALVQERWEEMKPLILDYCWSETLKFYYSASGALDRDAARWPIDKNHKVEIYRMGNWISERVAYFDRVVYQYSNYTLAE